MSEQLLDIPVGEIYADDDFNCRGRFSPLDCTDLARDIQEVGLTQPIVVRPYKHDTYKYIIVVGHRRYMAVARINQSPTIKAIVREMDDEKATFVNFSENLKRTNLDIVQEGEALSKIRTRGGYSVQQLADKTGKSYQWVQVRLDLLKLPPQIQEEARLGNISQHHIKRISRFRTEEEQFEAVRKIKEGRASGKKLGEIEVGRKPPQPDKKTARKPHEIQKCIDWCLEEFGEGLHTYFLSWAAGFSSNLDLMTNIKAHMRETFDEQWEIPKHAEIPEVGKVAIPGRDEYV